MTQTTPARLRPLKHCRHGCPVAYLI